MTKCVVYIDAIIRGMDRPLRSYFNAADSLGMSRNFFDSTHHTNRLFTLDSRCMEFPNPKAAAAFVDAFVNNNSGRGVLASRDTIGYHGINENGNPCPPFRTYRRSTITPAFESVQEYSERMEERGKLVRAYDSLQMPFPAWVARTTVGREGCFDDREVLGEIAYLMDNMVDEELDRVNMELDYLLVRNWVCTDIEKEDDKATLYFTTVVNGESYHCSLTIVAFNLLTPIGMNAMRQRQADLAARIAERDDA